MAQVLGTFPQVLPTHAPLLYVRPLLSTLFKEKKSNLLVSLVRQPESGL